MNFNNKLPEWKNSGTEPSDSLKNDGFKAGYKPSANVFNWLPLLKCFIVSGLICVIGK